MKAASRLYLALLLLFVFYCGIYAQEPKDDFVIVRGETIIDVLENDNTPQTQLINVSSPEHCLVSILENKKIKIVPNIGYDGTDMFSYFVIDKNNVQHNGYVHLTIIAATIDTMKVHLTATSNAPDSEKLLLTLVLDEQIIADTNYFFLHGSITGWDTVLTISSKDLSSHRLDKVRLIINRKNDTIIDLWPWTISVNGILTNGKEILIPLADTDPSTISNDKRTAQWKFSSLQGADQKNAPELTEFGNEDTSYAVLIGASFDLISKVKISNIYSSIYAFTPNLWNPSLCGLNLHIGFDAGLYQYRTLLGDIDESITSKHYMLPEDTTKKIYRTDFLDTPEKRVDNLGLYFNPAFKITSGIYATVNFELRRQTITTIHHYTVYSGDTAGHSKGFIVDTTKKVFVFTKSEEEKIITDKRYFGLGAIFEYGDENIALDFAPAILFEHTGKLTWIFPFNITGLKNEIRIGGEVRYTAYNITDQAKDYEYLVYIAKSVPVSDFLGAFNSIIEAGTKILF